MPNEKDISSEEKFESSKKEEKRDEFPTIICPDCGAEHSIAECCPA